MDILFEAMQRMENKESEQALQLIEEHLPSADDEEKFAFIEFYVHWGFYDEATSLLKDLLAKYPKENELKIMLANIYIERDADQDAIQMLNDIHEEDPFYEQALLLLADLYQSQGLFEVAEQKLLIAKRMNPHEQVIDLALGEFYFSLGNYQKAVIYYERLAEEQVDEIANISISARLAEALAGLGKYEKSLTFFQEIESEDPDVLFKYGLTAYQADQNDLAIQVWEKVLVHDEFYHSVYEWLAKAYADEGEKEQAYKTGRRGLQFDEFNEELYYHLGKLAYELGEIKESEFLLQEALQLHTGYVQAALLLSELYKEQDNHDKIITMIQTLKDQESTDPHLIWELSRAYESVEKYDQALKYYEKAYEDLQSNPEFLKEYGYFLIEEGNFTQAIAILKKYLTEVPLDEETKAYVARMEEREEDFM